MRGSRVFSNLVTYKLWHNWSSYGIKLSIMGYFFEHCSKAYIAGKKLSIIGWSLNVCTLAIFNNPFRLADMATI